MSNDPADVLGYLVDGATQAGIGQRLRCANMTKQLLWLAETVNEKWQKENPPGAFAWKHNALPASP